MNQTRQDAICILLAAGYTRTMAAQEVGIGKSTIGDWVDRGNTETEGIYRDFVVAAGRAESLGRQKLLMAAYKAATEGVTETETIISYDKNGVMTGRKEITRHKPLDARVGIQILERLDPDEFSPKRIFKHETAPPNDTRPPVNLVFGAVRRDDGTLGIRQDDGTIVPVRMSEIVEGSVVASEEVPDGN